MSTYDDIAEWYDHWVGTHPMHEDPFFPAVEAFMGEVAARRICDLACGQGRVARHLADLGAHVVGIDLSEKLLAIARRYEETAPRGIEYVQADAQNLDDKVLGLFDGVVCFMALMDIPDLASTLHSVARILRPAGWFVFAILHPCFHTSQSGERETAEGVVRTVSRYFVEGYWRSNTVQIRRMTRQKRESTAKYKGGVHKWRQKYPYCIEYALALIRWAPELCLSISFYLFCPHHKR